jgi:hypothetical protein
MVTVRREDGYRETRIVKNLLFEDLARPRPLPAPGRTPSLPDGALIFSERRLRAHLELTAGGDGQARDVNKRPMVERGTR